MAKTKVSQKGTPRQETVRPVIQSPPMEIIRKTDENGERSYYGSFGEHVETYEDDLYNYLSCLFDKIDGVINLLGDAAHDEFGFILDPIITHAQWQLYEVFERMSRSIGEVNIDLICRSNGLYQSGRIVGVSLKPPREVESGKEVARAEG